jgi:hypothetical protein
MKALGFFCYKCRQFWSNEDIDMIIEQELREKSSSNSAIGLSNIYKKIGKSWRPISPTQL